MATRFLQFLTVMEVTYWVYQGPEVSKYVAEIFVRVLMNTPEYAKKDYVQALDITFMKIDELIDSE